MEYTRNFLLAEQLILITWWGPFRGWGIKQKYRRRRRTPVFTII